MTRNLTFTFTQANGFLGYIPFSSFTMFKVVSVCCCLPMLNAPEEQNRVESLDKAIASWLV